MVLRITPYVLEEPINRKDDFKQDVRDTLDEIEKGNDKKEYNLRILNLTKITNF